MSFINMVTLFGTRSQHALQVNNVHNKYTHGHNRTPPFLVQSSELIKIKKIACQQALFHPLKLASDGKHKLFLKSDCQILTVLDSA